jgi:hypothetical protein
MRLFDCHFLAPPELEVVGSNPSGHTDRLHVETLPGSRTICCVIFVIPTVTPALSASQMNSPP